MPDHLAAILCLTTIIANSYTGGDSIERARVFVQKNGTDITSANTDLKTVMSETRSQGVVTRRFMSIVLSGEYADSVLLVEEKWTHNFNRVEQVSFLLSPSGLLVDRSHRIVRYSGGLAQVDDLSFPLEQANETAKKAISFWAGNPSLISIKPGAWASTRR